MQKISENRTTQESICIPVENGNVLHMRRIRPEKPGPAVFMLHGAVENAQIFYSENGKGLGPFLAENGYDVYAADLRGRGLSTPHVGRGSDYGQNEAINTDIPAFLEKIRLIRGSWPDFWIAHSWGGVLLTSHIARYPERSASIKAMVYFGSKRMVRVWNIQKILLIDLVWKRLSRLIIKIWGYLPAKKFRMGSDDESDRSHLHCKLWVQNTGWIDRDDGFDYGSAVKKTVLPQILYLAAENDMCLGNPADVKFFMEESGGGGRFVLIGKKYGNRHDYDHVSMMTHPDAPADHFPLVLQWMRAHQ